MNVQGLVTHALGFVRRSFDHGAGREQVFVSLASCSCKVVDSHSEERREQ